jgi:hypothetical protein
MDNVQEKVYHFNNTPSKGFRFTFPIFMLSQEISLGTIKVPSCIVSYSFPARLMDTTYDT